ncbi:MAG: ComEC/Rec2 family competence protein [Myxococcota bacterium]
MTLCWYWSWPTPGPSTGSAAFRGLIREQSHDRAILQTRHGGQRIRVRLEGACGETGDLVSVRGRWRGPRAPAFDGAWSESHAWRRQGLTGGVEVEGCRVLRPARPGLRARLRERVRGAISFGAEGDAKGVLMALSLGERVELSPNFREAMSRSGLAHLLVVSGLHIGFVVGAWVQAWGLLFAHWPWLRHRWGSRGPAALFGLPVLLLYAGWIGPSPSVLRASLMSFALLLGAAARRRGVRALFFALIGCALVDPSSLEGPSLQLSAAAVGGISALRGPGFGWLRAGWGATVATLPFTCFWFSTVSWTGFPATVLVGPLVAWVLVPGALVATGLELLFSSSQTWTWLAHPAELLCGLTRWTAELPGAGWAVPPGRAPFLGAMALAHLAALRKARASWALVSLLGLLMGCAWPAAPGPNRLVFLPVGHGTAIVVHDQAGVALIDTGRPWATRRVVMPYLRHHGVNRLERLVLSHEDDDHDGGADVLWPRPRSVIEDGARPRRWGPLRPLGRAREEDSDNDRSLVLIWESEACSALLPGDIEVARESRLLQLLEHRPLLAVPHHGSSSSSSPAFLARVRPRWAVITVGPNGYGLPDPQIVARLRQTGAKVLRTDRHGQIEAHCLGSRLALKTRLAPAPAPGSSSPGSER